MKAHSHTSQQGTENTIPAVFSHIRKRDGRTAPFDTAKIKAAILKAGQATGEFDAETADQLTDRVLCLAQTTLPQDIPTVVYFQKEKACDPL